MNTIYLFDVDNTLLDNDKVKENIKRSLTKVLGKTEADHFWTHHDSFRVREQLVDFPHIIGEYCREKHSQSCDTKLAAIFNSINFTACLYEGVSELLKALKTTSKVVIFTEGDHVYQKAKIEKSGLAKLVDEVLLFEHKMQHLGKLKKKFAGKKMIFVEDKADNLAHIKSAIPEAHTIIVCQGHYGKDFCDHSVKNNLFKPDRIIEKVSELS